MGLLDPPGVSKSSLGQQLLDTVPRKALAPFYLGLASRDSQPVDILGVLDSVGEGQGATNTYTRWVRRMLDELRARFPTVGVIGGEGYIPAQYIMPNPTGQGFTASGTTALNTSNGLGRRSVTLSDSTGSLTITRACTSFDVLFTRGIGTSFDVSIDGGTATTVSTTGTGSNAITWNSGALSAGQHTVTISNGVAAPVVEGVMFYFGDETKGIRYWDGAHAGYKTTDFGAPPLLGNGNWYVSIGSPVKPKLIILGTGLNDYGTAPAISASQYQSDLTSLISQMRSKMLHPEACSILLLPMYERGDSAALTNRVDTYDKFVAAMYSVAAADSYGLTAVCDIYRRLPASNSGYLGGTGGGIYAGDLVHPKDGGHGMIGHAVAGFLASGMGGDPFTRHPSMAQTLPEDLQYLGWTLDPAVCSTGIAGAAGTVYGMRIPIRQAATITNLHMCVSTAGATLANAFAALYQGGKFLAATADQSTAWTSTGEKKMPLTAPQAVAPGYVDVVWWVGSATTQPQMLKGGTTGATLGSSGNNLRTFSANTGVTSTPPPTLSTKVALSNAIWAAIS